MDSQCSSAHAEEAEEEPDDAPPPSDGPAPPRAGSRAVRGRAALGGSASVDALLARHAIPFHVALADGVLTTYCAADDAVTLLAEYYARSGDFAWLSHGESKRHESLIQERKQP
ncbi:hypothetical protein STCU_11664 [Strigomonas culicis]|uniref:Uncharacterized protein n=1 Tax=Strigomonas culicis TaxID=28005 RepID=S9UMJ5_9TRYP|nr:hypothetical protein STCU_11664 [Strigomonas culicis]|eukprot:EPY15936.1 hypothetical protein STCU_11664 [Strigomonas culicis]